MNTSYSTITYIIFYSINTFILLKIIQISLLCHGTPETRMNTAFLHDGTEKCAVVTKSVL